MEINYHKIDPADTDIIELITKWYLSEWNIPVEITKQKLFDFPKDGAPFQVLMTIGDIPVATGGIYRHVALLDREPRFNIYKHWLALVYTIPESRGKGLGALLCRHIQDHAKSIGLEEIFLFTHTAESLYKRLDWQVLERPVVAGKEIVVMKKKL